MEVLCNGGVGDLQGVDITIPVTCSVFEPDPMTSQCTRGVPRLKFRHKIDEMWVIFSFVLTSLKFHRRIAKHHCCVISHGAILGPDDVTGQGDLAGWPYLYYRALGDLLAELSWREVIELLGRYICSTFSFSRRTLRREAGLVLKKCCKPVKVYLPRRYLPGGGGQIVGRPHSWINVFHVKNVRFTDQMCLIYH